ncbi:hypothetical protein NP493_227g03000 [Ridgeia piscesae]|uniref:Uncharacterized protein n=1 Tax=Ridgeia piscesae TaxID=27915 RepID=A0AAD9P036_RIDPI|nr:hypothetical protein NP493_227g03000 [Ridgeia piscesae]
MAIRTHHCHGNHQPPLSWQPLDTTVMATLDHHCHGKCNKTIHDNKDIDKAQLSYTPAVKVISYKSFWLTVSTILVIATFCLLMTYYPKHNWICCRYDNCLPCFVLCIC